MVNFATFFINCTSDNVYDSALIQRDASVEQVAGRRDYYHFLL